LQRAVWIDRGRAFGDVCKCLLECEIFTDANDGRSDGSASTDSGTTVHHDTVVTLSKSLEHSRDCLIKLALHLLARFAVPERDVAVADIFTVNSPSVSDWFQSQIEIICDFICPERSPRHRVDIGYPEPIVSHSIDDDLVHMVF
jgi:hypothetical protein